MSLSAHTMWQAKWFNLHTHTTRLHYPLNGVNNQINFRILGKVSYSKAVKGNQNQNHAFVYL